MNYKNQIPPAQLWVGNHELLCEKVDTYLQQIFCSNESCNTCTICRQLRDRQFHGTTWLEPVKQYTLDQLGTIFQTLSFALNAEQHHFFIMQHADYLTTMCANKLLKSIEEPPPGYHFILLASREDALLPTIRSRCVVQTWAQENSVEKNDFLAFLTTTKPANPIAFTKLLDQKKLHERNSMELIDALLLHWTRAYTQSIIKNDAHKKGEAEYSLQIIKDALHEPPMPGSAKIFWKNVFLRIKNYDLICSKKS